MDRVFLDANVLFSAAYDRGSRLRELWTLRGVELVTSTYAAVEAMRNIADKQPHRLSDLSRLLHSCGLVTDEGLKPLAVVPRLAEKDLPILTAAVACQSTHLLTGDKHFKAYFGRTVEGVLVLRPGDYLRHRLRLE